MYICVCVCLCALGDGRSELLIKLITGSPSEPNELEFLVIRTRNLCFFKLKFS